MGPCTYYVTPEEGRGGVLSSVIICYTGGAGDQIKCYVTNAFQQPPTMGGFPMDIPLLISMDFSNLKFQTPSCTIFNLHLCTCIHISKPNQYSVQTESIGTVPSLGRPQRHSFFFFWGGGLITRYIIL